MRSSRSNNDLLNQATRTFKDYVGLKLHFNSDINWKLDLPLKLTSQTLMKRKDAFYFFRLTQEYSRGQIIQRLISMFMQKQDAWIGSIFQEEFKDKHKDRMRNINSISYVFRTDIDRLIMFMEDQKISLKDLLKSDGQSPYIITNMSDIIGGITDETLALLDRAFKFTRQETIDPLWDSKRFLLNKYSSLIEIDKKYFLSQLDKLTAAQVHKEVDKTANLN